MSDTNKELLPCPFCGGEAKYYEYTGEYQNVVRCKDIACAGSDGVWGDWIEDPATVTRWNTRSAISPAHAARVLLDAYPLQQGMVKTPFNSRLVQSHLRTIALDTTTATCDNTREGE